MYTRLLHRFKTETDKPYIIYLLAVIAFLESVIFPIPVDIFTLTLASAHPKRWFQYGLVATTFSVLGAVFGYVLGVYLFDSFGMQMIEFYGYEQEFVRVTELFKSNTFLVMFTSAFTPIPYKVFTIVGGALKADLFVFIVASLLGRGLRFFAETWIPYRFGPQITQVIKKYFKTLSWLLALVVIFYLGLSV